MHIYIYMHIHIYKGVHIRIHIIYTYIHTYTRTYVHTYICQINTESQWPFLYILLRSRQGQGFFAVVVYRFFPLFGTWTV